MLKQNKVFPVRMKIFFAGIVLLSVSTTACSDDGKNAEKLSRSFAKAEMIRGGLAPNDAELYIDIGERVNNRRMMKAYTDYPPFNGVEIYTEMASAGLINYDPLTEEYASVTLTAKGKEFLFTSKQPQAVPSDHYERLSFRLCRLRIGEVTQIVQGNVFGFPVAEVSYAIEIYDLTPFARLPVIQGMKRAGCEQYKGMIKKVEFTKTDAGWKIGR